LAPALVAPLKEAVLSVVELNSTTTCVVCAVSVLEIGAAATGELVITVSAITYTAASGNFITYMVLGVVSKAREKAY
jgi:hypothetical protein